jgi:hypothetical protein
MTYKKPAMQPFLSTQKTVSRQLTFTIITEQKIMFSSLGDMGKLKKARRYGKICKISK